MSKKYSIFSKKSNKFRLYKGLASGIMVIASVFSAGKVIKFVEDHFTREKKKDRFARFVTISLWWSAVLTSFYFGLKFALKQIKRLRGGYLLDLFDREKYEITDSENSASLEEAIRKTLRENDMPEQHEKGPKETIRIPTDEDATEFNLG